MAQVPSNGQKAEHHVAGIPQRSGGERSEPERSGGIPATAAAAHPARVIGPAAPDPEVIPKPRRRTFTTEYQLRIVLEAEKCTLSGEIAALLRREGLYSSHLWSWRKLHTKGLLVTGAAGQRGRRPKPAEPAAKRVAQLERENRDLTEKLRKAQIIIDFQKKVQALLSMQDEDRKP